jgi:hypothetical protein
MSEDQFKDVMFSLHLIAFLLGGILGSTFVGALL